MEVQCWGALGDNVCATVCKGMSVIVVGRIVQSTWEANGEDGKSVTRSVLRVRATHVGPDLGARNVLVNVRKAVEQNAAQNAAQNLKDAQNPGSKPELVGVGAGGQEEEVEPAF